MMSKMVLRIAILVAIGLAITEAYSMQNRLREGQNRRLKADIKSIEEYLIERRKNGKGHGFAFGHDKGGGSSISGEDHSSESREDPCETYFCANGGECFVDEETEMPKCNCTGEWNGTRCDADPCDGVMCQNGGTCLVDHTDGSAQCCCTAQFQGPACENQVDPCTFSPCENGGTCTVNDLGLAECNCPTDFGGLTCEIDCNANQPCPADFVELPTGSGNCYYICDANSESWLAAQDICLSKDATLWEPNDAAEVTAVTAHLDETGFIRYWTGAFDGVTEDTTVFIGSGETFTQPFTDTNTASKDCVEIRKINGVWEFQYRACAITTRRCICERPNACQTLFPLVPPP